MFLWYGVKLKICHNTFYWTVYSWTLVLSRPATAPAFRVQLCTVFLFREASIIYQPLSPQRCIRVPWEPFSFPFSSLPPVFALGSSHLQYMSGSCFLLHVCHCVHYPDCTGQQFGSFCHFLEGVCLGWVTFIRVRYSTSFMCMFF